MSISILNTDKNYDTKYAASINGVLVFWGLTPAKSGRGSFVTSIEDYNSTTRSQTDAYVPIGKSFVHDYENVGAVITPLTKIEGGIRVSVYFTKTRCIRNRKHFTRL